MESPWLCAPPPRQRRTVAGVPSITFEAHIAPPPGPATCPQSTPPPCPLPSITSPSGFLLRALNPRGRGGGPVGSGRLPTFFSSILIALFVSPTFGRVAPVLTTPPPRSLKRAVPVPRPRPTAAPTVPQELREAVRRRAAGARGVLGAPAPRPLLRGQRPRPRPPPLRAPALRDP